MITAITNPNNIILTFFKKQFLTGGLLILCLHSTLSASTLSGFQQPEIDSARNIFELLSQEDILEVTITTDIGEILKNKYSEDWRPGVFKITGGASQISEKKIKLRPRGKYRLKVCDFPPLKIKFKKEEFKGEGLKAHESLKLVTHCSDAEEAQDLILKEFLAYKMYNIITDQSLRVQLVKINWVDSKGFQDIGEKWGFLIESEKQMAKRIGGKVLEIKAVSQSELNIESSAIFSFYQYMIGNPDWKYAPRQNLAIVRPASDDGLLTIPYDFDFSGLVNAPYAVSGLGLTSVQERIYLGESKPDELDVVKDLLKSKKKEIISLIKSFEFLEKSSRREVLKYIRSFYATINYPLKGIEYYQERLVKRK